VASNADEEMRSLLPSLASLSIGGLYPNPKRQRKVDLKVTKTQDTLRLDSTQFFLHLGCVSAAEMIIAKVTLDAVVKVKKQKGVSLAEALKGLYKEFLLPIWLMFRDFEGQIREKYALDPSNRDLARCYSLLDLRVYLRRDSTMTMEVADKYTAFLENYLSERGFSMSELMSRIDEDSEEEDDEDDEDEDHGDSYEPGVSGILMEYFLRPNTYMSNRSYTDVVRATVDGGNNPCVAIVMMSFHDDPHRQLLGHGMKDIHGIAQVKPRAFTIQGIVACPIYKYLRRISVGAAFLTFFENLSRETDRYIVAYPVGNSGWLRRLQASERVLLWDRESPN
jgi:hypothetical protein